MIRFEIVNLDSNFCNFVGLIMNENIEPEVNFKGNFN